MTRSPFPFGPVAVLLILIVLGCAAKDRWQAGRPPVHPVSGSVTYDGKPLPQAIITFLPVTGSHTAFGRSDDQGNFRLTTFDDGDGAVAGDYNVTVTRIVVENEPDPRDPEHLPPLHHAEYSMIPENYAEADKSGLTLTVPEGGAANLSIALTGKLTGKFDKGKPKNRLTL